MTCNRSSVSRGAAPVGALSELPPVELAAILYLRLWFTGKQHQVWNDFARALGHKDARTAMANFEQLMQNIQKHARHPLMHHGTTCRCFGGDEGAFAHFVAAATYGNEHDAMTFALHLFDGVQARSAVGAAAMCGLAFADMANKSAPTPMPKHTPTHQSPPTRQ